MDPDSRAPARVVDLRHLKADQLREMFSVLSPEEREQIRAAVAAPERTETTIRLKKTTAMCLRKRARRAARRRPAMPTGIARVACRPRERRERRHVARATSSSDGGDSDPSARRAAIPAGVVA